MFGIISGHSQADLSLEIEVKRQPFDGGACEGEMAQVATDLPPMFWRCLMVVFGLQGSLVDGKHLVLFIREERYAIVFLYTEQ